MGSVKKLFYILFIFINMLGFHVFSSQLYEESDLLKDGKKYLKEWKEVDSLAEIGLPKSALKIVNSIYDESKSESNQPQYIKAVIYKLKLEQEFEEDFFIGMLADLEEEIKLADFPVRSVLHSMAGEMYWLYYLQNRYRILERSTTTDYNESDIATWDVEKIVVASVEHYESSLTNANRLFFFPLKRFDDILEREKNSKMYRPTLFDFLAFRALDFFKNEELYVIQPVETFNIDKPQYFSKAEDFVQIKIGKQNYLSFEYHSIRIFQQLLQFHMKDKNLHAFIDADLKRLDFVYEKSVAANKKNLYLKALGDLSKKHHDKSEGAPVLYALAKLHYQMGKEYKPISRPENQWDIKKAYEICLDITERFPGSQAANNSRLLMERIKRKNLELAVSYAVVPKKEILANIKYQNISTLYFRVIKMDPDENRELRSDYYNTELISQYLKKEALKEWKLELPDENDYQPHAVETDLPALDPGYYIILASSSPQFATNGQITTWTALWVTNLSYISRCNNDICEFYILDRTSGKPIKDVFVKSYYRKYDYDSRAYKLYEWKDSYSDKNGRFTFGPLSGERDRKRFFIKMEWKDEKLYSENYFALYPKQNPAEKNKHTEIKTYFFTDRAIYRPGQTIYFKGIMMEVIGDQERILTNRKTKVKLYDVNFQEVASITLTTNEFGSFSGSFTAPVSGLTGQMTISNDYNSRGIRVEEYKRPKFEVEFLPVEGNYKLNEIVSVKGLAKAYAGNAIDNADVVYRVVRSAYFPYYYGWWWPSSTTVEITNGTTRTDENGNFMIEFNAIPDAGLNPTYRAVFNYQILADVTDLNGETHSTEKTVSVGQTNLLLTAQIPEEIEKNNLPKIPVTSTNLNGEKLNVEVNFVIYKLKEPERILHVRRWERPDKYILSQEEYEELFPYHPYNNEMEVTQWGKSLKVFEQTIQTENTREVELKDISTWESGKYLAVLEAVDAYGEKVSKRFYFDLFSFDDKKGPAYKHYSLKPISNSVKPGETDRIMFSTPCANLWVLFEVEYEGEITYSMWKKFSKEQQIISYPVGSDYKGNIYYHLSFVKHNRAYNETISKQILNKENDLSIELLTFRDKMKPGDNEEWILKVKDHNGEKIAAEILAAMYDASLDAFTRHYWPRLRKYWSGYYSYLNWHLSTNFRVTGSQEYYERLSSGISMKYQNYDKLNWFGFFPGRMLYYFNSRQSNGNKQGAFLMVEDNMTEEEADMEILEEADYKPAEKEKLEKAGKIEKTTNLVSGSEDDPLKLVPVRKNFMETVFFYPHLHTDEEGNTLIKFTMPDALTRWKFMAMAHSKQLQYGYLEEEVLTQKELMVVPNAPRFFREGDTIVFTTKVSNLANKELSGDIQIHLFNSLSMENLNDMFLLDEPRKSFYTTKGQSDIISWKLTIPVGIPAVTYRIIASSGNFSDGEEMSIPVLTNRMLVTESMPLSVRAKEEKTFSFDKLLHSGESESLEHQSYTLEFTSNPAWYAIQALPYLMEYPYECAEQIFSRYYANSIASFIINSNEKIKKVFESWKQLSPDAFLSNLEKNQELKSLLLEETPWLLSANKESERKRRIALLFDLNKMDNELTAALYKLKDMQTSNGGWPWFEGMKDNRYITQHIVAGMGHLKKLGIKSPVQLSDMIRIAVYYLDKRMEEDYEYLLKHSKNTIDDDHLYQFQIHYLYARSSFLDIYPLNENTKAAFEYYENQAETYWMKKSVYMQAMIGLALHRMENKDIPGKIIRSLKEKAIVKEEMGMYWKSDRGYFWYQAPVETQALLIEFFDEVANDQESVEEMKIWLIKQKQTQNWETTKATVEACYALLLRGTNCLQEDKFAELTVDDQLIDPTANNQQAIEAGTGYFKTKWAADEVHDGMGNIKVKNPNDNIAWGAAYWQYFEDLDKITLHETPLKLEKKLFIEKNTAGGPVIAPLGDQHKVFVGDKVIVRIILRVDRDMEYVHMKDMRASAFEPLHVRSGNKYQDGLSYYESTGDASTNFFFSYLRKGTYVFEYPLYAAHEGEFSNGITTIQCMYAPEFTSHSEGVRVNIERKND